MNQSNFNKAVANVKKPKNHQIGKHIERKSHLTREVVQRGNVLVEMIAFANNIVDLFAK